MELRPLWVHDRFDAGFFVAKFAEPSNYTSRIGRDPCSINLSKRDTDGRCRVRNPLGVV